MIEVPDSRLVHRLHPSPNIECRRNGLEPTILLLHYTGMTCAEKAVDWLSRPESKVSAHYVIDTLGRITQLVAENMRAWHAGVAFWQGETDINSASIGIEIHNPGHEQGYPDFPATQMAAVIALARDIVSRHSIRPDRVLAHSDVAPRRKIDPGEKFDWSLLARQGVGHWITPEPVEQDGDCHSRGSKHAIVLQAQRLLSTFGYDVDCSGELDEKSVFVVKAFQRHFRPARVNGAIDRSTVVTLERLVDLLPLERGSRPT